MSTIFVSKIWTKISSYHNRLSELGPSRLAVPPQEDVPIVYSEMKVKLKLKAVLFCFVWVNKP